jgi:hypothetical protein
MNNFSEAIKPWETFYVMAGTAAVTLIGLLFISISINIELFRSQWADDLQHFAALTFNCFFYVLMLSIFFLVPGISYLGLGIPILILGILGTMNAVIQQRRSIKNQQKGIGVNIASKFNIPIGSLVLMILLSIGILLRVEVVLYGFIVIIILLLGSASQNAWALLIEFRK